jgi:hypothetical protein
MRGRLWAVEVLRHERPRGGTVFGQAPSRDVYGSQGLRGGLPGLVVLDWKDIATEDPRRAWHVPRAGTEPAYLMNPHSAMQS